MSAQLADSLYIRIGADITGFTQGLKEVQQKATAAATTVATGMQGIAAKAFDSATTALGNFRSKLNEVNKSSGSTFKSIGDGIWAMKSKLLAAVAVFYLAKKAVDGLAESSNEGVAKAFQEVQNKADSLGGTLLNFFGPVLQSVAAGSVWAFQQVSDVINGLHVVGGVVAKTFGYVGKGVSIVFDMIMEKATQAIDVVKADFALLGSAINLVWVSVKQSFVLAMGWIQTQFAGFMDKLWSSLDWIPGLEDRVQNAKDLAAEMRAAGETTMAGAKDEMATASAGVVEATKGMQKARGAFLSLPTVQDQPFWDGFIKGADAFIAKAQAAWAGFAEAKAKATSPNLTANTGVEHGPVAPQDDGMMQWWEDWREKRAEELAKAKTDWKSYHEEMHLESLSSLDREIALEEKKLNERLGIISKNREAESIKLLEAQAAEAAAVDAHEALVAKLRNEYRKKEESATVEIENFKEYWSKRGASDLTNTLGSVADMMDKNNKQQFKYAQMLSYGQAVVSTAAGIAKNLELGWPWCVPAMIATAAAGAAQITAISRQKYGGGGGAPSASSGAGSSLGGSSSGGGGPGDNRGGTSNVNVVLNGQTGYSAQQVRGLMSLVKEQMGDNLNLSVQVNG